MFKTIIGLIGIVLFLTGLALGNNLHKSELRAAKLDDKKTAFAEIGSDSPPFCSWDGKLTDRVMAENKSQAIVIEVSNSAEKECESTLTLRAPGFDTSPSKEEQKISLPAKGKGSLSWILTPRRSGTFEIALSDVINTKIYGISVTNVFGLSALQAKLFSGVGTLFGPMFTIPWWWDKWSQRKQKQDIQKNES